MAIANTVVKGQYFGAVNSESDDFYSNPNSGVIGGFTALDLILLHDLRADST